MNHLTAFRAAREWATEHGHPQPDDRMLEAYGKELLALAAAEARGIADRLGQRDGMTFTAMSAGARLVAFRLVELSDQGSRDSARCSSPGGGS